MQLVARRRPNFKCRAPRVPYRIQATLVTADRFYHCEVINLSATGILLLPPVRCCVGASLDVVLPLPGSRAPVQLKGWVVREGEHSGRYALGIDFDLLPIDVLLALMWLVTSSGNARSHPHPEEPSNLPRGNAARKPSARRSDAAPREVSEHDEADVMGTLVSRQQLKDLYAEALEQLDSSEVELGPRFYHQRRKTRWP